MSLKRFQHVGRAWVSARARRRRGIGSFSAMIIVQFLKMTNNLKLINAIEIIIERRIKNSHFGASMAWQMIGFGEPSKTENVATMFDVRSSINLRFHFPCILSGLRCR